MLNDRTTRKASVTKDYQWKSFNLEMPYHLTKKKEKKRETKKLLMQSKECLRSNPVGLCRWTFPLITNSDKVEQRALQITRVTAPLFDAESRKLPDSIDSTICFVSLFIFFGNPFRHEVPSFHTCFGLTLFAAVADESVDFDFCLAGNIGGCDWWFELEIAWW